MERTTLNALALLPLPDPKDLTEPQVRGAACLWCPPEQPVRLDAGTAVDLGERRIRVAGISTPVSWFPRACRKCVAARALAALHAHAPSCKQCGDEAAECVTGRALYRIVREHRR